MHMEISRVPTFTAAVIINLQQSTNMQHYQTKILLKGVIYNLTLGQNVLENTTASMLEYVHG